jgi:hypothetical protein
MLLLFCAAMRQESLFFRRGRISALPVSSPCLI